MFTANSAFSHGYDVFVLEDCCADRSKADHDAVLQVGTVVVVWVLLFMEVLQMLSLCSQSWTNRSVRLLGVRRLPHQGYQLSGYSEVLNPRTAHQPSAPATHPAPRCFWAKRSKNVARLGRRARKEDPSSQGQIGFVRLCRSLF
jgi:hypothetical protein